VEEPGGLFFLLPPVGSALPRLHRTGYEPRWDHFPVAAGTWPLVLGRVLQEMRQRAGGSPDHVMELESILTAIGHLPPLDETDPDRIRERQRERDIIKGRLTKLMESSEHTGKILLRVY